MNMIKRTKCYVIVKLCIALSCVILAAAYPGNQTVEFTIAVFFLLDVLFFVLLFRGCYLYYKSLLQTVDKKNWNEFFLSHGKSKFEELDRIIKAYAAYLDQKHSAALLQNQAQISALQNQINPHFLYNTLDSIRGQAILEGSERIAKIVEALSAFFRYNISQKSNMVTLQDELNNIWNYFAIQEYRFKDKFKLQIDVDESDEDIYKYFIPKLTIQPIVENAIYHGLETKASGGEVTIHIVRTIKKILIRVSDNGKGMAFETLKKLNHKIQSGCITSEGNSTGTGIALVNVDRRIKLIYGQDYGITVYSTENVGTDVEIALPIMTKEPQKDLNLI